MNTGPLKPEYIPEPDNSYLRGLKINVIVNELIMKRWTGHSALISVSELSDLLTVAPNQKNNVINQMAVDFSEDWVLRRINIHGHLHYCFRKRMPGEGLLGS